MVTRLPNGNLLVPVRVEGPDGFVGHTAREVSQQDPKWNEWIRSMERQEDALCYSKDAATRNKYRAIVKARKQNQPAA